MKAVHKSRFTHLFRIGDFDAAMKVYQQWRETPYDEFEDCKACADGIEADFFFDRGDIEKVASMRRRTTMSCNLEPARFYFTTALARLLNGDVAAAFDHHKMARASLGENTAAHTAPRGHEFELLARSGQLGRALSYLRKDSQRDLMSTLSSLSRLRFLIGVLGGLSANLDQGDQPTGITAIDTPTVADLHRWVLSESTVLATAFDARNGNNFHASLIERALAATRVELPQCFEAAALGKDLASGQTSLEHTTQPQDPLGERLSKLGDQMVSRKRYADAATAYEGASEVLLARGLIKDAGFALANTAQSEALCERNERANDLFAQAVSMIVSDDSGATTELVDILVAWSPVAVSVLDVQGVIDALNAAIGKLDAADTAGMSDDLAQRTEAQTRTARATALDCLARTLASVPDASEDHTQAVNAAMTAAETFGNLGATFDAAHSFWLAARILRAQGNVEDSLYSFESALEGFWLVNKSKESVQVSDEFVDALHQTGQHARAAEVIASVAAKRDKSA